MTSDSRPLIAHVVYRFDTGGLENGVVNLINNMPESAYRHAVIALTDVTDFSQRIKRNDVNFFPLNKNPGHAIWIYPQLYNLFRRIRPDIVHTRNLAALEAVVPAWLAGVKARIHGEHGRDVGDYDGTNKKYQWIRRIYSPFVKHYIALSRDLAQYLTHTVGFSSHRVTQIYNGVDAIRFHLVDKRQPIPGSPFNDPSYWVIGTVGRMQTVKDQTNLVKAFIIAHQLAPEFCKSVRLVLVGDGPLRNEAFDLLQAADLTELAWLPGERRDIPTVMQGLDCFVLPSIAEGISNTILEAMATGLPVIATAVGGNPELVEESRNGSLVPPSDPDSLAQAIIELAKHPENARSMGQYGRRLVEDRYSMNAMVSQYQKIYDRLLQPEMRHPLPH